MTVSSIILDLRGPVPIITNPNISNPNISNPNISNPNISNPNISNPNISNPNISNPNISNPNISSMTVLPCPTVEVIAMDICIWITSKGGWTALHVFDIMTLVSAYLGQTNLGFTITVAYIMGAVAYYLNNLQSGNSLTGCSFT